MSRTTRIFCVSTLHGAATVAAAIESGCFPAADRRLLLVCDKAAPPEAACAVDGIPGAAALRAHFDAVISWNDAIRPFRSGEWSPRPDDIPLFERHLRLLWDLGDDRVALVMESVHADPALAVARSFTDASIDVYADGLMSYGPTRRKIESLVGTRVRRLLHLDLVPGLTPLLLSEFDVPARIVPTSAFLKVLSRLGDLAPALPPLPDDSAVLLGQHLTALDVLAPHEELDLHVRMMRGAVARGHRAIVFKPHPTAPAHHSHALEAAAGELGADLTLLDPAVPAGTLFEGARPALVVGCFSTALFTASAFYDLPVARAGTEALLNRLTPYHNSNRVPLTLADALLPPLEGGHESDTVPADTLAALVTAVGFVMQPQLHTGLRPAAERFLSQHFGPHTQRYFKRRRLTSLGLPGGAPEERAFLRGGAGGMLRRGRALRKAVRR